MKNNDGVEEPEKARKADKHKAPAWSFYSANDDDYKLAATQDEDSDESHTPIAEEVEVPEVSQEGEASQSADASRQQIEPVEDTESPVLHSPHCVGDVVLHNTDGWDQDVQLKPNVQSNSIWKPLASPLGDPNEHLADNTSEATSEKTSEVPVDLSRNKETKPETERQEKTKTTKVVKPDPEEQYLMPTSSDDDSSDEDALSTLAAYCQAKLDALYDGFSPNGAPQDQLPPMRKTSKSAQQMPVLVTTVDKRPTTIIAHRPPANTNTKAPETPLLSLVRVSPPRKRLKLTPSRVKVDLSMPLCSREESNPNQASTDVQGEIVAIPASTEQQDKDLAPATATSETSEEVSIPSAVGTSETIAPVLVVSNAEVFSTQNIIVQQEQIIVNQPDVTKPKAQQSLSFSDDTINEYASDDSNYGLVPIAFVNNALSTEMDAQLQIPSENAPTPVAPDVLVTSVAEPAESCCAETQLLCETPCTTDVETASVQKLPSIDEIFHPMTQTYLTTTSTVERTVTSVPTNPGGNCEVSSSANYDYYPSTQWYSNTGQGPISSSRSTYTPSYYHWGRSPYHRMPYPYSAMQSPYSRWPGPYSWPYYSHMAGSYPSYYASPHPACARDSQ